MYDERANKILISI